MDVASKSDMLAVKNACDKANGYIYGRAEEERTMRNFATVADASGANFEYAKTMEIRERHMKSEEEKEESEVLVDNDLDKFPKGSFQV